MTDETSDWPFRRLRLPWREVFAEGVETCISPRTDCVAVEQNNLTFLQMYTIIKLCDNALWRIQSVIIEDRTCLLIEI